jgi:tetratricopeptide (TPR) repeat protein
VHFGAIEQIKAVKTSFVGKDYYGVDFWVVQLTEPVDYKLSKSNSAYILTLAKSKAVKLDKKEVVKKQITRPEATKSELNKEPPLVSIPPITPATHKPLEKAIQLRQKGYRYQTDKDYDKALTYYQKAIQVDPYYATAHNDLGVIYYIYLNDTEKAIEEFKKALEINPNYLGAHTNLALIYEDLGRKEAAIKHWAERARLGDPEDYWTKLAKQKLEESIE